MRIANATGSPIVPIRLVAAQICGRASIDAEARLASGCELLQSPSLSRHARERRRRATRSSVSEDRAAGRSRAQDQWALALAKRWRGRSIGKNEHRNQDEGSEHEPPEATAASPDRDFMGPPLMLEPNRKRWSRRIGRSILVMTASTTALSVPSAAAQSRAVSDPFGPLEGRWRCSGHLIATGKPLSSEISFRKDLETGALVVRHDDLAPGQYHALELWTPGTAHQTFRATIADSYNGSRWFSSPGWSGRILVWTRYDHQQPAEQFAYEMEGPGALKIDWSVARDKAPMTLGDTLRCTRS